MTKIKYLGKYNLRNYGIMDEVQLGLGLERMINENSKEWMINENSKEWMKTGLKDRKIRNANDKIDVIIHRLEGLKDRINEAWMVDCETHKKNIKSSIIWYVLEDEE